MPDFIIAVLVRNRFGVLNRVTSMFRRRRFNIKCLTVSETESPEYSRITVTFEGDGGAHEKQQLIDQLYKLEDVCFIKELENKSAVTSELLLIKVKNDPETRALVRDTADAFGAVTMDYTRDSVIMQMTGSSRRVSAFIDLMRDYTILEICRTGVVSLERGSETIRKTEL